MTLEYIYDLLNFVVGKNQAGNTLKPSDYNKLLTLTSDEILNSELVKLVQDELTPISDELISISPLRVFLTDTTLAGGLVLTTLPADYVRWTALGALYGGSWRDIEVVRDKEFNKRRGNVLYHPEIKPFTRFRNDRVYFIPNDLVNATLTYIRKPVPAYYDYCQDASTLLNIYMPVGSYVTAVGAAQVLYDVNDNVLNNDVTGGNINVLPYTSQSVELEWEDRMHEIFILHILSKMGLPLSKAEVTQYAEALKKQ